MYPILLNSVSVLGNISTVPRTIDYTTFAMSGKVVRT